MSEIIQDVSLSVVPEYHFSVAERTDLAIATLKSLGLIDNHDKALANDVVGVSMQVLHDSLNGLDVPVEPFLGISINSKKLGLGGLLKAFDDKQQHGTFVADNPWANYSAAELGSRYVGGVAVPVLESGARAMLLGADELYGERGLYYTGRNLSEQLELAKGQQLLNVADYMMLNAQRREAGEHLLDVSTFTRFIQLEQKAASGSRWLPGAISYDHQVYLHGSDGSARSNDGVRLLVG